MSKETFLYQINFNRKKYPEICKALDEAKNDLGVAWYLRELISKDIAEKKGLYVHQPVSKVERTIPEKEEKEEPRKIENAPSIEETGGFL